MAKSRGVESKLTQLRALRDELMSDKVVSALRQSLNDASSLVVVEAANMVGDLGIAEVAPELVAAFDRLMIEPKESDKQCRGKIALVEALNKIEYFQPEVYLRGVTHVQEPMWGDPTQDAAGPLRAHCALGLARIRQPGLILQLTEMLLDSDDAARVGAVQALAGTSSLGAIPLLRFKALIGDAKEEVMGECFESLLSLAEDESLPFVARFLDRDTVAVRTAAVFALAETRRPEAFALLAKTWPHAPDDLKESLLLGISLTRLPAALDFLVGLIARKDPAAPDALLALAIHRHNSKVKESVAAAVLANGDPAIQQFYNKKFRED